MNITDDKENELLQEIASATQDAMAELYGRPTGVVMIVARQADDPERTDLTLISCLCPHLTARVLRDMADDYIADHPELTDESIAEHIKTHA